MRKLECVNERSQLGSKGAFVVAGQMRSGDILQDLVVWLLDNAPRSLCGRLTLLNDP